MSDIWNVILSCLYVAMHHSCWQFTEKEHISCAYNYQINYEYWYVDIILYIPMVVMRIQGMVWDETKVLFLHIYIHWLLPRKFPAWWRLPGPGTNSQESRHDESLRALMHRIVVIARTNCVLIEHINSIHNNSRHWYTGGRVLDEKYLCTHLQADSIS